MAGKSVAAQGDLSMPATIRDELEFMARENFDRASVECLLRPRTEVARADLRDVWLWFDERNRDGRLREFQVAKFLECAVRTNVDWRALRVAWERESGDWPDHRALLTIRAVCDSRKRVGKRALYLRGFVGELVRHRFPMMHGAQSVIAKTATVMLNAPVSAQQVNQVLRAVRKLNDSMRE